MGRSAGLFSTGPGDVVAEVRRRVSLSDVVGRCTDLKPNGRAGHYVGLCFEHGEKTPSLRVYPSHYHCFGCGAHGDVFDAYRHLHGGTFVDALRALAREVGIDLLPPSLEWVAEQELRRATTRLLSDIMVQAERWLWDPPKGADALAYLRGRGLSDDTIRQAHLGFWPTGQSHAALEGDTKPYTLEQFREVGFLVRSKDDREYDILYGCIVFPVFMDGQVAALTGRRIGSDVPKGLAHRKLAGVPCPSLYGMQSLGHRCDHVVVSEGEIDTLTLRQAGVDAVGLLGATANQGDAAQTLLDRRDLARATVMLDADPAGEAATRSLCAMLGSLARVARPAYPEGVKDPNDLLRSFLPPGGAPSEADITAATARASAFFAPLLDRAPSFLDWILADIDAEPDAGVKGRRVQDEVIPLLADVDEVERAGLIDRVAAMFGKWLKRPAIERAVKAELHRRSPSGEPPAASGEGISGALAAALVGPDAPFLPLFLERNSRDGTIVTLYSQRHAVPVQVSLSSPRQVISALAPELGDVEQWAKGKVPSLETREVPQAMLRAMCRIASELRPRWDLQEVADGLHSLGTRDRPVVVLVDTRMRLVCRNGLWIKADSPIIDDRYLLTSKHRVQGWAPADWTPERLNQPLKYTALEAFNIVFQIVATGWQFRDHESGVDPFIVAALPFALVWSQVFPTKPLVHFNAETESGKSMLVQGFFAGMDKRLPLGLLPTAYYNPDPSSAGIVGAFSGSSRTVALDEFEPSEDRHQGRMDGILRMMRTASTGSSARLRGTQDQGAREDTLSVACIAASIEPIGSRDADRNRWFRIELKHIDKMDGPEITVPRWIDANGVDRDELRRSVVFGLLDRVEELQAAYLDIQHDLTLPNRGRIDDRWMSNVWPCLAVAKVLGLDHRELYGRIAEAKAGDFRSIKADRKGNRLLDALLHTPFEVPVETMGGHTTRESTTLSTQIDAYVERRDWSKRLEFPWLGVFVQRRGADLLLWVHPETAVRSVLLRNSREFSGMEAGGFTAVAKDCARFVENSVNARCDLSGGGSGARQPKKMTLFCLESDDEVVL